MMKFLSAIAIAGAGVAALNLKSAKTHSVVTTATDAASTSTAEVDKNVLKRFANLAQKTMKTAEHEVLDSKSTGISILVSTLVSLAIVGALAYGIYVLLIASGITDGIDWTSIIGDMYGDYDTSTVTTSSLRQSNSPTKRLLRQFNSLNPGGRWNAPYGQLIAVLAGVGAIAGSLYITYVLLLVMDFDPEIFSLKRVDGTKPSFQKFALQTVKNALSTHQAGALMIILITGLSIGLAGLIAYIVYVSYEAANSADFMSLRKGSPLVKQYNVSDSPSTSQDFSLGEKTQTTLPPKP